MPSELETLTRRFCKAVGDDTARKPKVGRSIIVMGARCRIRAPDELQKVIAYGVKAGWLEVEDGHSVMLTDSGRRLTSLRILIEVGRLFRFIPARVTKPANYLSFAIAAAGRSSGSLGSGALFAQRVALELEAMSVVHDAVQNGVGDGGLGDDVMPAIDGDLAGD
jgi:hypothetical protein